MSIYMCVHTHMEMCLVKNAVRKRMRGANFGRTMIKRVRIRVIFCTI